jgi:hypothetical protein
VKQIASGRLGMVAARYGEHTPMATVCCNGCRTCVTTNLVGLILVGLTGAAGFAKRLVRRA